MTRRRLILAAAAGVLGTLMLLLVITGLVLTRTQAGQDFVTRRVRAFVADRLVPARRGKMYIGRIDISSLWSRLGIDSLSIYDASDSLLFSSGRLDVSYDLRDLYDSRIDLRTVKAEHPYIHLRQHANESWNFEEVFQPSPAQSLGPRGAAGFSWGSYITLDSVRVNQATFILSLPWHPDDTLRGPALDSSVQRELRRPDHSINRTPDGFDQTRRWTNLTASLPYIRLADPDSDRKSGKVFEIGDMTVDESDPPFLFQHASGLVRLLGDSVWASITHVELPASTGEAQGKVVWGGDLPIRYDVHVRADSLCLNDINFVYPTLPRTGCGKALVTIKNESDPRIMDYRIDSLDLHTMRSHVTGTMTFGVNGPMLAIRSVDLAMDPLDFDVIRTMNGKDFPIDWRGQLIGGIKGPGGPLTDFLVDDVHTEFRDAHVPGAVSAFSGHGGLNIVDPATAEFHDFQLHVDSLDLRSVEFLFPDFPRLCGTFAGDAMLDSMWMDVRFRDADLTQRCDGADPTHVTGAGRITTATKLTRYDVQLAATPLSFDLLAISYPKLPVRGLMSGPIRLNGDLPDLEVQTTLSGLAGSASFDGQIDGDSAGGYGAHGRGNFAGIEAARLTGGTVKIATSLNGHYEVDATGSTFTDLAGTAAVDLEQSTIDTVPLSQAHARVGFANGILRLADPFTVASPLGMASATGGFGFPGGGVDSLDASLEVDSVQAWRHYFTSSLLDSLSARVVATARIRGGVDAFGLTGTFSSQKLGFGTDSSPTMSAAMLGGTYAIADVRTVPRISIDLRASSLQYGTFHFDSLDVRGQMRWADTAQASFAVGASGVDGRAARAVGVWSRHGTAQTVRVDSGFVTAAADHWALQQPARFTFDGASKRVDTLVLASQRGRIAIDANLPDGAPVTIDVKVDSLPLRDVTRMLQMDSTYSGLASFTSRITGTAALPEIQASATLDSAVFTGVRVGNLSATGAYRGDSLAAKVTVLQDTSSATATLSIPLHVSLFGYEVPTDGPVNGSVDGTSIDLALIKPFFPTTLGKISGRVDASQFHLRGTMRQPWLDGSLFMRDTNTNSIAIMPLGDVTLTRVLGHVEFFRDSIKIDTVRARSGAGRGDHSALVRGTVKLAHERTGWASLVDPAVFDSIKVTANDFTVLDTAAIGRISVSVAGDTGSIVVLNGPLDSATVRGKIAVKNSVLYAVQQDTLTPPPSDTVPITTWVGRLMRGVQLTNTSVVLGDNVALQSLPTDQNQLDVRLTGDLDIQRVPKPLSRFQVDTTGLNYVLALKGTLTAVQGGTYTINGADLFQRTFTVVNSATRRSTIIFSGAAGNIPRLDIQAEYVVKQYGRPDVAIYANLIGPLPTDTLTFSSNLGYELSQADYLSYLVVGQPGLDWGQNASASAFAASLLGPTVNAFLGHHLGGAGKVSFNGASADPTRPFELGSGTTSFFTGGRFSANEMRVSDNVFVTVSAGLCPLASGSLNASQFGQGLGGQAEYRLNSFTRFGLGLEPSTQALLCSSAQLNLSGLAPTPRQFSFFFGRIWNW